MKRQLKSVKKKEKRILVRESRRNTAYQRRVEGIAKRLIKRHEKREKLRTNQYIKRVRRRESALSRSIHRQQHSYRLWNKRFEKVEAILAAQGNVVTVKALANGAKYVLHDKAAIKALKQNPPKIVPNRIVFETNDDFTDNGRALFDYMIENHYQDKYEIIWLVNDPAKYKKYNQHNVKFVQKTVPGFPQRSLEAFTYALSAKYIFFTQAFNWIGVSRKEQILFNLWHGCGYKSNKGDRRVFFDYVLVPGDLFIETKKEFFHCSEKKILPIGYPRYDKMLHGSDAAAAFCERILKEHGSDQIVLWMPTYRHATSERLNEETLNNKYNIPIIESEEYLRTLDRFCHDNRILLVIKSHYLQVPYDFGDEPLSNILYLTNADLAESDVQLYEFIHYSDAMISDYSSVSIDYLLMDKPIGFTLDDFENYTESRGWVFDDPLEYMPGEHIYTEKDLLDFLTDIHNGRDKYKEQRDMVRKLAHNPCEDYCRRVVEFLNI